MNDDNAIRRHLVGDADDLVLIFIPSLVALLARKEDEKGAPLTREEVEAIRDNAKTIAIPRRVRDTLDQSRGYPDIDADNVWEEWRASFSKFRLH